MNRPPGVCRRWRERTKADAAKIFADLVNDDTFVEFLTLPAYERID